jgi:predicted nucleic acid-binding protein
MSAERTAGGLARNRQLKKQGPRRLLADFIIGSHALAQADRLMTLDPKRYKQDFPELKLI